MRRALLLIALLSTSLWAVEPDTTAAPAPAAKSTAKKKKSMPRPLKRLRAVSVKVLTPNPNFQGPKQQSMPVNSPVTPQLNPEAPTNVPQGTEKFFRAAANIMTTTWKSNIFVWLPAFSTDPNGGPTYGLMPVLVLSDSVKHHIKHLFAPSYTYNSLFGHTGTFRYYLYPTDESQLFTNLSYSQHVNEEVKLRYENTAWLDGRAFVRGEGFYHADASQRFFGIGPTTQEGDEAGYTAHEKVIRGTMGVNFFDHFRFTGGARYRRYGFSDNIVPGIADIATAFPQISRNESNVVATDFHLVWDSRDFPVTPSKGNTGELFVENTMGPWGSQADFFRYGVEGKRLFPWRGDKQTSIIRGVFDQANGSVIPFYEMASVGGRDSLRGYGDGRFRDRGRIAFNVEHRVLLTAMSMMGVETKFEVGPFFDVGEVFPSGPQMRWDTLRPVVGGAFRAVVKPNVVGSVDVGVGKDGVAAFVDINYPF